MKQKHKRLLKVSGLAIRTLSGRLLFQDLNLSFGYEQVAIIGRNGVGKSTLLKILAGLEAPTKGKVCRYGSFALVPQSIAMTHTKYALKNLARFAKKSSLRNPMHELSKLGLSSHKELSKSSGFSQGQHRKIALFDAKLQRPDLLLLDEPTEALDASGREWLLEMIKQWDKGLIVVSHDRQLLRQFQHFFILGESGGQYFQGSFEELENELERVDALKQKKYSQNLRTLEEKEWHNARVCRRRARKKNLGRIHETGRSPSRALLNTNRSYAQVSQGRAAKIRKQKQEGAREWTKSTRRALDSKLALELSIPKLPPEDSKNNIMLEQVTHEANGKTLFSDLSFDIKRDRIAIQGENGSGKTTLLQIMLGLQEPDEGRARCRYEKIGSIAQDATDWLSEESLVTLLSTAKEISSLDEMASLLVAHKFPLSLAQRSLKSLSPGERLRAALICLFERSPAIECLILDEPTYSLDFVGLDALEKALALWPGGLVVVSHDQEFLDAIGIEQSIHLA